MTRFNDIVAAAIGVVLLFCIMVAAVLLCSLLAHEWFRWWGVWT